MRILNSIKLPVFLCLLMAWLPAFGLDLPVNAETDRLLLAAEDALESNSHREARDFLSHAQALNSPLPNQFYFLYGTVLFHLDEHNAASKNLVIFVQHAKRGSPDYKEALGLLTRIEKKHGQHKSNSNKQTSADSSSQATSISDDSEAQYIKGITQLYLSHSPGDALLKHINDMLLSYALKPTVKIIKPGQRPLVLYRLSYDQSGNIFTSSQKTNASKSKNTKSIVSSTKISVYGVDPFITYRCSPGTNSCWLRSPVNGSQWIQISNNEQATAEIARATTALIKLLQKGKM